MKKVACLLIVCMLLFGQNLFAHPGSRIDTGYDKNTMMLDAVVYHNVKNPKNHFIDRVTVSANGNVIIEQFFGEQDNNETQTVSYRVPSLSKDDKIEVRAYCNREGNVKAEVMVEETLKMME
ncbi:MAG: hypothetical protein ABH857_05110 [Elusimicrobiota bacterium]